MICDMYVLDRKDGNVNNGGIYVGKAVVVIR